MKPVKKAVLIAGIVVVVLAVGFIATGFYVKGVDTVFPNVSIGDTPLAGMTAEEARLALIDAGYEDSTKNVAVSVNFPDATQMTISGEESGVRLLSGTAAETAYNYGKDGSFFKNEFSYIKSLFSQVDLSESGTAAINEERVRAIVTEYADAFNEKSMQDAYALKSDSIEIVKGSNGMMADADELFDLVVTAFDQSATDNKPVTIDYVMTNTGTELDLESLYDLIYVEPVSAVYDETTYDTTQSVTGVSFDVNAAQRAFDTAAVGQTVTIPLIYTEPEMTTVALEELLFRDILSERKTYVAGTSSRRTNVKLAAAAINGKVLNPGEEFSYNETVGKRTAEKGYKSAGAYVNGQVVQEIGGGICQVSSTLYTCVLFADLEVVDRSNHMFIVSYLPLGYDATVNWGTVDFKFKNNTDYPIRIETIDEDGYLTVKLHGTKTNTNYIDVQYVVISSTPYDTIQKEDESIAPGTTKNQTDGHTGYVVETYKYIYDENDELISKTFIARSPYRKQDKVVLVPLGTLTPVSPSPSPSASPSESPSASPSTSPSPSPSASPSESPSASPSTSLSPSPSASPSPSPSASPTPSPSESPAPSSSASPDTSSSI